MKRAQSVRSLPMKAIYRAVVEALDARIARLRSTRAELVASAEVDDDSSAVSRMPRPRKGWTKGRARKHGADQVVLGVIRDGADTMKAITAAAKVKAHVARAAVQRLITSGHVTPEGAATRRRYRVTKK